jgi:hypothetical protein
MAVTFAGLPAHLVRGYRALLWSAEMSTVPTHGRPFSWLSAGARAEHLRAWTEAANPYYCNWARAVLLPIRSAHYDCAEFFDKVGVRYRHDTPKVEPVERWMQQVTRGDLVEHDLELECEVVVIGSGAGGAACAHELASRGRAVLLLEEGRYYGRKDFNGRPDWAYKNMYRDYAMTLALGNVGMPVWAGRAVGGSTAINSGTCYRAPERTLTRWRRVYGLADLSLDSLAPYYERVEAMLGVAIPEERYLGGVARVVARGASALGLRHGPVPRNAPGCDGAGVCAFGCPTGAKRSTDVSYVPAALERGAQLVTSARVHTIVVEQQRARGVVARLASGKTLRVEAEAVVVAGGTLMTPLLLRRNKLCLESGWLGRNLSIHPASKVMALFEETIDMANAIPQSYAIDHYAHEGLMFEGGSVPPDITVLGIWHVGQPLVDMMEQYRNLAIFGFMIQDMSRGRVLPGAGGSPLILYSMSRLDARRMQRGIEILCDVFLAAGAKRVYPFVQGQYEIGSRRDLDQLRRRRLMPGDFEVTSYHPLGTCRMGADPARSCVGPDHQAHHVRSLYVVDGSALPSSLGSNPQLTIMAMALRAGEIIDSQLG